MKLQVIEGGRSNVKFTQPQKKTMNGPPAPAMHNLQEVLAYAIAFGYSLGKTSHSPMTPEIVEQAELQAKQNWRDFIEWAEEFESDYQDEYEEWLAVYGDA